jgi:HK97 gp10 family phage protein
MNIDHVIDTIARRIEAEAAQHAGEVEDDIRQRLNIAYPPASSPGDTPHRRTGNLSASTQARVVKREGDRISVDVANTAEYAEHLEFGTDRMEPRPFMGPALQRWTPIWSERAKKAAYGRSSLE